MSREELALETQLLLQEVTQVTQHAAVESVLENVNAPPPVTEFEAAKDALLAKLRRKKEASRAQQQQLNQQRYGPQTTTKNELFSPRKARAQALKLPVAATAAASSRKKQDMLYQLKMQAVQQGAQHMAKFFGYSSYEEQLKHLNRLEKKKILEDELNAKEVEKKQEEEEEEEEDELMEEEAAAQEKGDEEEPAGEEEGADVEKTAEGGAVNVSSPKAKVTKASPTEESPEETTTEMHDEEETVKVVRRRNRIQKHAAEEEDGNEADSEQDEKEGDEEPDEPMEDVAEVEDATSIAQEQTPMEVEVAVDGESSKTAPPAKPKDKAAGYRSLLRAEALQNRKRKRLIKGRGDNFVESEAEEDEEEDALKIGGLGDFGFGVPQAKTQESKEAEEERNALKLREDDLDHIVDDLSDDERAQEQDLEEMFRQEQENQDREQVKEVMRNVKEGFGRNRRAFSGLHSGSGARGRFNLDELVAADGSKFEAARLGLLESDEELSEGDEEKKKANADGDEEKEEEEDEEAEMERVLRERFTNQPKIYVTSSESGSDDEEENDTNKDNGPDGDEVESDEERERQQMKLFSERARINRRMQRMKDLQRQIALENNEADPTAKTAAVMPNLLLEEDEDSQELMNLLNRTDVDGSASKQAAAATKNYRTDRPHPKLGRFNSYGGITSASRSSSSFSRVVGHCKLFSANSTGAAPSKGFVFTSFSSDKAEEGSNENAVPNHDEAVSSAGPELTKSKSWSGAKAATKRRNTSKATASNKKRKSGGLFSVLSSYQCVSSTSQSQES